MSVRTSSLVLSWLLTTAACGFGYRLLVQRGRLLLRLEELERQARDLTIASAPLLYGEEAVAILQSILPERPRVR